MNHRISLFFFVGLAAVAGCGTEPAPTPARTPTGPFTKLIVFGDSGSDTGNLRTQTSGLMPGDPYYNGRFCNGPIWVDGLAERLGLDSLASLQGGRNYAHGAAGSGPGLSKWDIFPVGPNLGEQIELYHDQPDGTELFVVWGGLLDVLHTVRGDCSTTPEEVANNIMTGIMTLYDRGGRSFLVGNLPDLGSVPFYRGSEDQAQATALSAAVNTALAAHLDQVEKLPGITVYRLDAASLLADSIAHPPPGVTNVTDPAWTGQFVGGLSTGEVSPNPETFLFWDIVHLSTTWHDLLATKAASLIALRPPHGAAARTSTAAPQAGVPPLLDFWLSYLSLAVQPTTAPNACEY